MTKITSVTLAGFVLAFGASVLVSNCSSDSKSDDDPRALCVKVCTKIKECFGTALGAADCNIDCNKKVPADASTTCTNSAEVLAKSKECASASCEQLIPCAQTVPACTSPAGAGGSPGAGGAAGAGGIPGAGGAGEGGVPGAGGSEATGGAGGTGGAGSDECADCAKADTCLTRLADAGAPNALTNACNQSAGTSAQATVIAMCKQFLMTPLCK